MTKLDEPTLILNRNWQPVGIARVSRALTKLFNDSAHVVDPETYQLHDWDSWQAQPVDGDAFIQGRGFRLRVPEVITLAKYDKVPQNAVTFSRRNIFKRDRFTCQYCGAQPGTEDLTIDHVLPKSRGGISSWTNCVLACSDCNHRKADRTPEEARMPLKQQPVKPKWRPIYATRSVRRASWTKFISDSYWDAELEE